MLLNVPTFKKCGQCENYSVQIVELPSMIASGVLIANITWGKRLLDEFKWSSFFSTLEFMSRQTAHQKLLEKPPGTFLIRFSDGELGAVTIAWCNERHGMESIFLPILFHKRLQTSNSWRKFHWDGNEIPHKITLTSQIHPLFLLSKFFNNLCSFGGYYIHFRP